MKRVLSFLLAILGFGVIESGCRKEYGSPHSEWEIKGIVTNQQGQPVKGIKVTTSVSNLYYDGMILTDEVGHYSVDGWNSRPTYVSFDDIDGDENGGEFNSVEFPVLFQSSDFKGGDGHWDQGKATKTVDVTMTLKTE